MSTLPRSPGCLQRFAVDPSFTVAARSVAEPSDAPILQDGLDAPGYGCADCGTARRGPKPGRKGEERLGLARCSDRQLHRASVIAPSPLMSCARVRRNLYPGAAECVEIPHHAVLEQKGMTGAPCRARCTDDLALSLMPSASAVVWSDSVPEIS